MLTLLPVSATGDMTYLGSTVSLSCLSLGEAARQAPAVLS